MNLSKPGRELKKRIKCETGFDGRFIGYRLHKRMGPIPVTVYSFKELYSLLNDPYPRIDFIALKQWILNVIKDTELAEIIGIIIEREESDHEKTSQIRDIFHARLAQCGIK